MSKVYLVHAESGEYSDWTFEPEAVFTTREAAVAWIEARCFRVVEDACGELSADFGNSYSDGEETVAFSKLTTHDGETWACHETTDGRKVSGSYFDKTWFVDELELDPTGEADE